MVPPRCLREPGRLLFLAANACLLLVPVLLLSCSLQTAPAALDPRALLPGATYLGEQVCGACHQQAISHWSHTVHAELPGAGGPDGGAGACESCHGPGSLHLTDPGDASLIIAFTRESTLPVARQNEVCLQCHGGGERLYWHGSAHALQDLACSDCHNPMANLSAGGLLSQRSINDTCSGCHRRERNDFLKRSHMPLPEGQMTCIDCHNPHGSGTPALLPAVTLNQLCFQCHQEKRGPFLWEHAPVRDSCMNCHEAHGSNHEALLTTARPFLCQQCHSNQGHPNDLLIAGNLPGGVSPDARLMNRSCQNCHAQIHGSNHPAGVRFHR